MTEEERLNRYKFLFRYEGKDEIVEKEVRWFRDAEEAFDRGCALILQIAEK